MTKPNSAMQYDASQQLENEILEAVVTSKHLKASLAQISRWSSVPIEVVETIASTLTQRQYGVDLERLEFDSVVRQIQEIESSVPDPGMREWKLQNLARKHRRTPRQLWDAYNKALCQQQAVQPLSLKEFKAQVDQCVDWLVYGWIPRGSTVLLHADGGVGKTLFAYQLLESVVKGMPWNGFQVKQGSVLLVQSDEPALVTAERMDVRELADDDPVSILSDWQVEAMAKLETYLSTSRPAFVIVDSLTSINRNCIFSENDTEYARPLLQLASLASKYNFTALIIHHSNADGDSRGTRAIKNSVSEVWGLTCTDGQERVLRVQKTRLGRPPGRYRFAFDEGDYSFTYLGEDKGDGAEETATQENRIRLWLSEHERRGVPFAPIEVSEALGISLNSARRILFDLWAKNLIGRRKAKQGKGYVYGMFLNVTSDRIDHNDHGFLKNKRESLKTPDQYDQFDQFVPETKPQKGLDTQGELINPLQSRDHLINSVTPNCHTEDEDREQLVDVLEPGYTVIPTSEAIWYRSGSDKVCNKYLPPSLKDAASVPVAKIDSDIGLQIQTPSKVLAVNGDRAKIRSQQSGRTSVLSTAHLIVVQSAAM